MHRLYENNDIVMLWDSEKCQHAAECVKGSPKTFNPMNRPWIGMSQADNIEIWQAIERCPSGALSCVYRHDVDVIFEAEAHRSVALFDNQVIGECDYQETEGGWNIYHTEVLPEFGGKGIAKRLVYKVLETAERQNVLVTATCSYAVKIMRG